MEEPTPLTLKMEEAAMPKKRTSELIVMPYFRWLLKKYRSIYRADGRSAHPSLGRYSLSTGDKTQALEELRDLDRIKAVELGKAPASMLETPGNELALLLEEGCQLYADHCQRPKIAGGPKATTWKRYRAVFDKFLPFARSIGVTTWNGVNKDVLIKYAAWLDGESYAYATEYLELTTIKQAVGYFIEAQRLSDDHAIIFPMTKSTETDTYCYTPAEVSAILSHCDSENKLRWLHHVLFTLAHTGLRISELAQLRWEDITELADGRRTIFLKDESTLVEKGHRARRETKGKYSRSFPVHSDLIAVMDAIPRASDGYIFHGPQGGRIKPDTVRNVFIREVIESLAPNFPGDQGGTSFKDGRIHSFRHFFCSQCANQGIPEQILMRWLGHRNSRMVQRYYHLHDDVAQQQMSRLKLVN
jgi:integrase